MRKAGPAFAGVNLYVCSARGELISLSEKEGKAKFIYATKVPMIFQPAIARGNVDAGAADGRLVCLKTGDASADGWAACGGNAQHNKKD